MLLEGVSEANQACRPGQTSKGTVVVAAAASDPRPGGIPGQQGHDGECIRHVPFLELCAERLWNAQGAGPEVGPALILGEVHRPPV